MPLDAREVPVGQLIETEVCIVGGGAAGLTVARQLAGYDFRVCLLEAGGMGWDEATQELCSGAMIGNYSISPLDSRARQYGGTANRWFIELGNGERGVRHTPLDEIDFEQRDWLPYSGWPFNKAHLASYYVRAQQICRIGPYAYEPEAWEDAQTLRLPLPTDRIVTKMFQFGLNTVFTRDIPDELNRAANFTVYLHANVVDVETDELGKTVTSVKVACLGGNRFAVVAKYFILATGGIENARLLLLSNQTQADGLGNQNDLVGRFFMVHPQFHGDRFTPASPGMFNRTFLYDLRRVQQVMVLGRLGLPRAVMERERLPNLGAMLLPREKGYWWRDSVRASFALHHRAGTARHPFQYLRNVVSGVQEVAAKAYRKALHIPSFNPTLEKGGWSYLPAVGKKYTTFEMVSLVEQRPDPNNRIRLGFELDQLGARKLELHWRWSESDHQQVLRARAWIGQELARAGLGAFELRDEAPKYSCSHHHIGTTRMHCDPRQGVVNADCKVHGVANLFVAGSSVFPTGGFANPTLTIVALAARLADHMKRILKTHSSQVKS
jgi:choline dehydrogenase-like flavoprotein